MDFVEAKADGFHCTWIFKCRVRNIVSEIMSENRENRDTYVPMNETAVHGILATGGGYSQLREFSAGVDMHCMSNKTFLKHMKKVSKAIDDAALQSMLDPAEEEKAIVIRDGNVDSDRVPMCTVVADGAWCKRSYKTNYDSLSGVVIYVTYKRTIVFLQYLLQNVLYFCMYHFYFQAAIVGFKNRHCSICVSFQNAKQTPPIHNATSIEADIKADGFLQSAKLLGLKFNKLIGEILTVCKMIDYTNFVSILTGDGGSSVHRKLLKTMPYGPNMMVEKVECKNHIIDFTKNTKFPVTSKNILKQQIPRFRTAVDKAIKYRAAGNEPLNTWICILKADVENSPLHMFGDHERCDVYFCNGNKEGEINPVSELKSSGLL
ncbi:hypothetical protein PR048_021149 [Dryococelus australis]|uniref:Mutator-like transposase domain-containing protein n=1 Tax=Dryococelus australis TaxID=614101 RepID=A0ABQ9GXG2_9NEOP|nr:hypothetical protein PR048_021149 [Dryococelus australis]